jgi:hypothetical protein
VTKDRVAANQSTSPRVKCDECRKMVMLYRESDGLGRPREDRPYRYSHHAGNKWGRPCRNNGEQYLGDEP